MDFTDGSSIPNFEVIKDEVREKFDELIRSQGYVSKEEFEALEAIAKRLESRLDELEAKTK
jgi:BMFP domain-containing protein YqiC